MCGTRLVTVDAVAAGTPTRLYGSILRGLAWRKPPPPSTAPSDGGAFVRAVASLLSRPELGVPPRVEAGVFGVRGGGATDAPPAAAAGGKRGRPADADGDDEGAGGLPPLRFVVAVHRAERLRRGDYPPGVLATLCRLGAAVGGRRPLTVVLLSEVGWAGPGGPPLPSVPSMTTLFFPPYREAEAVDVLTAMIGPPRAGAPAGGGGSGGGGGGGGGLFSKKSERQLWAGFLTYTLSVLHPSGADVRELARVVRGLWTAYVAPVRRGSRSAMDATGLYEDYRPRLSSALAGLYRRTLPLPSTGPGGWAAAAAAAPGSRPAAGGIPWHLAGAVVGGAPGAAAAGGGGGGGGTPAGGVGGWADLPGPSRLLLLGAYLGWRTPPRRDARLFAAGPGKRRRGATGGAAADARRYAVPLERLLAIYRALVGMSHVADDAVAFAAAAGRDGGGAAVAWGGGGDDDPTGGGVGGAYAVDTRLLTRLRGLVSDGWLGREGGGEALDEPRYRARVGRRVAAALAADAGIDLTMFFQE